MITISIDTSNDSFDNPDEVARVLSEVVKILGHKGYDTTYTFKLYDINGNSVGICAVDEDLREI